MVFSSIFFIFAFLPAVLAVYFIAPRRLKNLVLLLFSLVFYAWGEPVYIFLMVLSIVYNYLSGLEIAFYRGRGQDDKARLIFWLAVGVNLGILGFFKYCGFLVQNLNAILPFDLPQVQLSLPIGISFYTFQTLSYIIDVYRGNVGAQRNIIDFGLYISMFPQLIAGPIVRYTDIEQQLRHRVVTLDGLGQGTLLFVRGLVKKVLLANNVGMAYTAIQAMPAGELSVLTAWVGALAYTFQIYFDFSGYSDMAIGLGRMFGFRFMQNFDHPYVAASVTEFWRRWHISLSRWFRDYVYIPLGGSRRGTARTIVNLLAVWSLTGLWHGAAWNFVAWGLYYGILLVLEKFVLKPVVDRLPAFARHLYTLLLVVVGWVLFSSPTLPDAMAYLGSMFGSGAGLADSTGIYYLYTNALLLVACAACSGPWVSRLLDRLCGSGGTGQRVMAVTVFAAGFVFCTAFLVNATYNPFLYFRF